MSIAIVKYETKSTEQPGVSTVVYPVHFIVQGRSIWLGWQSIDEPGEALLKKLGGVLLADTKDALVEQCLSVRAGLEFEDDVVFDLDGLLKKVVMREDVCANDVINCWNMMIDIRASLGPGLDVSFDLDERSSRESYDHFFSATSAGDILDFGFYDIDASDMEKAIEMVTNGMAMLLEVRARA